MTPGESMASVSDPSKYLLDSHERRLESLERGQTGIVERVAENGVLVEQCNENVRALSAKVDQLPEHFTTIFRDLVEPLTDHVSNLSDKVTEVSKTVNSNNSVIAHLKEREGEREEKQKRQIALKDKYKAGIIAIAAAGIGAILKGALEFLMKH